MARKEKHYSEQKFFVVLEKYVLKKIFLTVIFEIYKLRRITDHRRKIGIFVLSMRNYA